MIYLKYVTYYFKYCKRKLILNLLIYVKLFSKFINISSPDGKNNIRR